MVSVQQVYNTLSDLANKDQKGFITPMVFNNFAALAQNNIYNELFQELVKAKQIQRQNFDPGRDKSVRKQTLEDLSPFIVNDLVLEGDSNSNLFFKPDNLSKIISISFSDEDRSDANYDDWADNSYDEDGNLVGDPVTISRAERRPIELVYDSEKIDRILTSNLSTPTESFPVALINYDIEVFPSTIDNIRITYYRRPGSVNINGEATDAAPSYNQISISGQLYFDPNSSLNFMLPSHYVTELAMEIGRLIGVRLRDPSLLGFASQEEASE